MKLYKGLLIAVLTTLTFSATAQSAPARSSRAVSGSGLAECGRYYYKATVTLIPEKFSILGSNYLAVINFQNPQAESVCGGERVNAKELGEPRSQFPYQNPRFVEMTSVKTGRASLLDRRTLTVGSSYKIACSNSLVTAKAVEIHEGDGTYVRFSFANARAEELCGSDRFHRMSEILDRTQELKKAALGNK
jgi:hypothetical protein